MLTEITNEIKEKVDALKTALSQNQKVYSVQKWFVSLLTNDSHEKTYPNNWNYKWYDTKG